MADVQSVIWGQVPAFSMLARGRTMWLRIAVFCSLVVNAFGSGYKSIRIGENIRDLPSQIHCESVFCEGKVDGAWIRVSELEGKVLNFEVIYVGTSLDRATTISQTLSLGKAVRLHSLREGLLPPVFGLATGAHDHVYGVVDTANAILYHVSGQPTNPDSMVSKVIYLSPDAPVLQTGTLPKSEASKLIEAAQRVSAEEIETPVSSTNNDLTFSSGREARQKFEGQSDVVIGKGKKTLALIRQVSNWYEVDEDHPEAKEKGEQLRQFLPQFRSEWDTLLRIYQNNKRHWEKSDVEGMEKLLALKKEIDSRIRQLEAMGFAFE
jgi:hypothetical protein